MVDVKCLKDCELQSHLEKLGYSPGPILPSTRKLYEKKLVQLLVSPPCAPPVTNGPREQDGPQDCDDSEGVLQEHQASESKTGLSTKRKTTARWTGARGAAEKASQWA
ncbi:PREDICTED: LEM domain-containing protein 1 isoform X3 [Propithecus coquereli]|uniref:LEM domain containing 1 n=1 Tax=Propithecus coquereli TaxID=379532 RepID=A0A2K6EQH0_PROCO|nr:PREDICTED: LEM domain-containing protein 1 isoform X3 [Propithecus coquereli]